MKLITTIVRPERLPDVKAALFRAGITGITLSRVSGHGGEHEIVSQYRGTTLVMEFHEKVKIEMVCSEPFVQPCIDDHFYWPEQPRQLGGPRTERSLWRLVRQPHSGLKIRTL